MPEPVPLPPFHFVVPVWGREFTRLFVETTLPALLASGNLPALSEPDRALLHILTRAEDVERISKAEPFQRARQLVPVEITEFDADAAKDRYGVASAGYGRAILRAREHDAAIVVLTPDSLLSSGSIAVLEQRVRSGARAVLVSALRTWKTSIEPALWKASTGGSLLELRLSSRDMVRAMVDHLHPRSRDHIWDRRHQRLNPSVLLWPLGPRGFLVHAFHLHPLLVWPREWKAAFGGTIDEGLVARSCPDPEEVCVIEDSDEICCVELSGPVPDESRTSRAQSLSGIVGWAVLNTNSHHRRAFRKQIRLHADDGTSPEWEKVTREADALVHRIDRSLEPGSLRLLAAHPVHSARRWLLRRADEPTRAKSANPRAGEPATRPTLLYRFHAGYRALVSSLFRYRQQALRKLAFGTGRPWQGGWLLARQWPTDRAGPADQAMLLVAEHPDHAAAGVLRDLDADGCEALIVACRPSKALLRDAGLPRHWRVLGTHASDLVDRDPSLYLLGWVARRASRRPGTGVGLIASIPVDVVASFVAVLLANGLHRLGVRGPTGAPRLEIHSLTADARPDCSSPRARSAGPSPDVESYRLFGGRERSRKHHPDLQTMRVIPPGRGVESRRE